MAHSPVDDFFAECFARTEYVDARLALDAAVASAASSGALGAVADHLDRLVETSGDHASARKALGAWGSDAEPPDGPSWRAWLLSVQAAVHRGSGVASPAPDDARADAVKLPRVSQFSDLQTANTATTQVLRANERAFRAWALDRGGWQRQHYYADLGQPVGTVVTGRHAPRTAATSVVVVMSTDPASGKPFILTSYPENALDAAVRKAFPDLCHWFGGYFGQDHEHPWSETRVVNLHTGEPARDRVRLQLDELLRYDDVALRQAVEALGSYVLPLRMREWVEAARWRLDAFDWRAAG